MRRPVGSGFLSPVVIAVVVTLSACAADDPSDTSETSEPTVGSTPATVAAPATAAQERPAAFRYPEPPEAPPADLANAAADDAIDRLLTGIEEGRFDADAVEDLAATGDPRHAWIVSDLLRFFGGDDGTRLRRTFETLTGTDLADDPDVDSSPWLSTANHLIAWDTPGYPGLRVDKSRLLLQIEAGWTPFFADEDADIDWRYLNWGGVLIDDRPLGDPEPCAQGCIPALDDPALTDAAGGDWYPDDAIVFGLVEGEEALAIPKNIAEIHEMFNLTLGGRRFAVPYCTLCGSAQAYRTDVAAEAHDLDRPPVLRTSGLLSRSNKVMYDLDSMSVFDTFTGAAVSGTLREAGVVLDEITTVRSTWGEWKAAHPDTSIIAEDGGIGRSYPLDPLRGRDDDGPIFPIGAVDDRLPEQELVVGVIAADGGAVAFPSDAASEAIAAGAEVVLDGVALVPDGDGLRSIDAASGEPLTAHEAFWFAWSQFHPDSALWTP
jgi:hypothetical protein